MTVLPQPPVCWDERRVSPQQESSHSAKVLTAPDVHCGLRAFALSSLLSSLLSPDAFRTYFRTSFCSPPRLRTDPPFTLEGWTRETQNL
ncbi:rCG60218 [Rattus norvegicus]|uniref:RCG60218 n=1 Tax=Rattus norvegicus TaxID=10116 RepID=A6HSJ5_RAT|nr:rCG60218 [Rattus norvegicus]